MIVNSDKIHVLFNRQKKTGSQEWGSQNKRTNHASGISNWTTPFRNRW